LRDLRRTAAGLGLAGLLGAACLAAGLPRPESPGGVAPVSRSLLPKDLLYPVPFEPGETLVYGLSWMGIEGGEMTLRTSRETSPDGVGLHHLVLTAESNALVAAFYPVRTRYETWVDVRDFQPVRFEKHAREGRYESDEVEVFDLKDRVGSWRDVRTPLPERIQDIISSFYYLRTRPLVPGEAVRLDLYSRGKIYRLSAEVLGRERVETEAGPFEALKVQPQLRETADAEDRNRGQLFLWFSDDGRRIPVMARTMLAIGSVTARLKRATSQPLPPAPLAPPAPPEAPSAAPG
jgi:hypothetical protein